VDVPVSVTDAVIVVPGILGSELVTATGETVWGLGLKQLAGALITGSVYDRLRDPTLTPGRLLRVPSWLPGFDRFEPYTALTARLESVVRHPRALLEFPYDWRRPVRDVAAELAVVASEHLQRWRRHPSGSRDARLTIIAHSMGGLVAQRAVTRHSEQLGPAQVRQILTLGTPFGGSVKAVRALATGAVLPLRWAIRRRTKEQLRALALDTASVYDLLPAYPCVTKSADGGTGRRPTLDDFQTIGANRQLAAAALEDRHALDDLLRAEPSTQAPIHALVGVGQPTLQSFAIHAGECSFSEVVDHRDWAGDGTVQFGSAYPKDAEPASGLPQAHGALAKTEEATAFITTKLLGGVTGPRQGVGLGLRVTDATTVGDPVEVDVVSLPDQPVTCRWQETSSGQTGTITLGPPQPHVIDTEPCQRRVGNYVWTTPGLYTVTVTGGGMTPVQHFVLVEPDE
jgi:pimeloyl-ACP methyl ester carboxylesterase